MILLVDNYDSFVHNLARYFRCLHQETMVVRNDALTLSDIRKLKPKAIVLSPGPCTPNEAGITLDIVRAFTETVPILGVCLGHQAIAQAIGANIIRAPQPMHGRTSEVFHNGQGLFCGLPSPLTACRYHSLIVDEGSLPEELTVAARTVDGLIMAIEHKRLPVFGVQFHPEAILTEQGPELLANFLKACGIDCGGSKFPIELKQPPSRTYQVPQRPVTF